MAGFILFSLNDGTSEKRSEIFLLLSVLSAIVVSKLKYFILGINLFYSENWSSCLFQNGIYATYFCSVFTATCFYIFTLYNWKIDMLSNFFLYFMRSLRQYSWIFLIYSVYTKRQKDKYLFFIRQKVLPHKTLL